MSSEDRHLSSVSVAWSDLEYFYYLALDGMLVHRRFNSSIREFKKTTTATVTGTLLNKSLMAVRVP